MCGRLLCSEELRGEDTLQINLQGAGIYYKKIDANKISDRDAWKLPEKINLPEFKTSWTSLRIPHIIWLSMNPPICFKFDNSCSTTWRYIQVLTLQRRDRVEVLASYFLHCCRCSNCYYEQVQKGSSSKHIIVICESSFFSFSFCFILFLILHCCKNWKGMLMVTEIESDLTK